MKKLLAILLVLMMSLNFVASIAEEDEDDATATESQFEKVLLQKGSLIIKEFIDYGSVGPLKLQNATLTDAETGSKYYAVRIKADYYNSQYDNGTVAGVMDLAEIDGAISTLEYIKAHLSELKDYSEIVYTASSGMTVGAYHTSPADDDRVFVKVTSRVTKYLKIDKIDDLIAAFKGVKEAFGN